MSTIQAYIYVILAPHICDSFATYKSSQVFTTCLYYVYRYFVFIFLSHPWSLSLSHIFSQVFHRPTFHTSVLSHTFTHFHPFLLSSVLVYYRLSYDLYFLIYLKMVQFCWKNYIVPVLWNCVFSNTPKYYGLLGARISKFGAWCSTV